MLWHDAPRGWYNDDSAAPAAEPAADLSSNDALVANDTSVQRANATAALPAPEHPKCICFSGLGVSMRCSPFTLHISVQIGCQIEVHTLQGIHAANCAHCSSRC